MNDSFKNVRDKAMREISSTGGAEQILESKMELESPSGGIGDDPISLFNPMVSKGEQWLNELQKISVISSNAVRETDRVLTPPRFDEEIRSITANPREHRSVVQAFLTTRNQLDELDFEYVEEILHEVDPEEPGEPLHTVVFTISNRPYKDVLNIWDELAKKFASRLEDTLKSKINLILDTP